MDCLNLRQSNLLEVKLQLWTHLWAPSQCFLPSFIHPTAVSRAPSLKLFQAAVSPQHLRDNFSRQQKRDRTVSAEGHEVWAPFYKAWFSWGHQRQTEVNTVNQSPLRNDLVLGWAQVWKGTTLTLPGPLQSENLSYLRQWWQSLQSKLPHCNYNHWLVPKAGLMCSPSTFDHLFLCSASHSNPSNH